MLSPDIRSIIKDKHLVVPDRLGEVTLCEKDRNVNMEVKLSGLSSDTLAIKIPGNPLSSLFTDGKHQSVCDYLIVSPVNGARHLIFIELKKTLNSSNEKRGCHQLRCSKPIWDSLNSVSEIHFSGISLKDINYVLMGSKNSDRLDKQTLKPQAPRLKKYQGISIKVLTVGDAVTVKSLL